MNFVYPTQGIEFEWDINKSESNFVKHGVRFEEAVEVFFDRKDGTQAPSF